MNVCKYNKSIEIQQLISNYFLNLFMLTGMSIDLTVDVQNLSKKIKNLLDANYINSIAKETGFILRERKLLQVNTQK